MKHLIETTDLSSLGTAKYDRIILDSTTNEIVCKGGVNTNGHSYVDLGLPSGLKWATMNVGATSETDYGDYFMWGSTTPNTKISCIWKNAPFNNGSNSCDKKYFNSVKDTVCPNGVLAKEYDTATQIMGGDWRMPTKDEIKELLDNTTNEWTQVNGVNGWKFTSKTNGSSIFFPAAGFRSGGTFDYQGDEGRVWSSSLNVQQPIESHALNFDSYYVSTNSRNRYYGFVVRGVL